MLLTFFDNFLIFHGHVLAVDGCKSPAPSTILTVYQRFLHIGSHRKQAAPRFVLEAPGWSHLHVVLQWPAKENNGDCSCAMPRENESVLRTIPFTAEKRLLRSSGPEPPIRHPHPWMPSLWYHQLWEPGHNTNVGEKSGVVTYPSWFLWFIPDPILAPFPWGSTLRSWPHLPALARDSLKAHTGC